MKKLIAFLFIALFPVLVFAKEYEEESINIKLNIKDEYVTLTRDNLDNNENLNKLGLTKELMSQLMKGNNIYFDIIKSDMSYEILVVVPKTKVAIDNLTKQDDFFLENLKKELVKSTGAEVSSIYKNSYNYVVVEYFDKNTNYYIVNYYTVVNSRGYNFQLQKKSKITDDEKKDLMELVDSVKYKVIEEKKETKEETKKEEEKEGFNYMNIVYGAILGAMAGIATYYIGITFRRIKSSKKSSK